MWGHKQCGHNVGTMVHKVGAQCGCNGGVLMKTTHSADDHAEADVVLYTKTSTVLGKSTTSHHQQFPHQQSAHRTCSLPFPPLCCPREYNLTHGFDRVAHNNKECMSQMTQMWTSAPPSLSMAHTTIRLPDNTCRVVKAGLTSKELIPSKTASPSMPRRRALG